VVSLIQQGITASEIEAVRLTLASAIKQDVSDLVIFDDHDPLGLAFYIQGIVRSGYVSSETNELALAGRLWVNEKLDDPEHLSVYKDRDLNAVALMLFSFHKRGAGEDGDYRFESLVNLFIDQRGAVCDNFFCSTLVSLALCYTNPGSVTLKSVSRFVDQQLEQNYALVLNDPKNLVVAYWWAQEDTQHTLKKKLLDSARSLVQRIQPSLDDLVYGSFILLEEVESMPRSDRSAVKTAVERALLSIDEHTVESLSPLGALHYGRDAATFVDDMEGYTSGHKPRLSRILISVGLILQAAYRKKLPAILSRRARSLQIFHAVVVSLLLFALTWFVWWGCVRLGLPADAKAPLKSREGWQIARGLGLLAANCAMAILLLSIVFWVYRFVVDLGIYGRCQDELAVLRRGWEVYTENLWALVALPAIMSLLVAVMT
jgi:hypothetical protein